MQTLIYLIIIAASVLQIVLFFKIWGMAHNIKKIKETRNGGDYYHWLIAGNMEKAYQANLNECVEKISDKFRNSSYYPNFYNYINHIGDTEIKDYLELYNARSLRICRPLPLHLQSIENLIAYADELYNNHNSGTNGNYDN